MDECKPLVAGTSAIASAAAAEEADMVWQCRLTLATPGLKPRVVSALESEK